MDCCAQTVSSVVGVLSFVQVVSLWKGNDGGFEATEVWTGATMKVQQLNEALYGPVQLGKWQGVMRDRRSIGLGRDRRPPPRVRGFVISTSEVMRASQFSRRRSSANDGGACAFSASRIFNNSAFLSASRACSAASASLRSCFSFRMGAMLRQPFSFRFWYLRL